ncbi:MAG: ethylbenzene dehydrogenase-related protein, partial [Rhodospirillales bacterium]|nr:ethylbenzene dehydrogenase-related protein [Rhodospirillales bacterium]
GSPMPSFVKALKAEDRWYLANFIKSLQIKLSTHQVLKPLLVEGAVPDGPEDAKWAGAEAMDVRLAGQVVVAPRWQNPSIDLVTIKSIRNTVEIAFLLEWDDPFKDETHLKAKELNAKDISKPGAFNSYVEAIDMVPRKLKTFRDSVALQFPIKSLEGTKKPYFLRGGSSDPVHLLVWKADSATTEESIARGWTQNPRPQPKAGQQSKSKSVWRQGRWSVVIKRPLLTEDRNDVQFRPGKFIPMAVNAWDGSNGEHGLMMSLSTWYFVFLEAPVPMTVYIWVLLAVIIIGGLGFWLMRKAEKGEMGGPRNLEENER